MSYSAINLQQKFGLFSEQWQPKVVAEMNDYQFKVVKLQGDFVWHDHPDTDERFGKDTVMVFGEPPHLRHE